ncbi:MAG: ParA family protein [Dehalobacter sp. 4CP]|nr:ParA family protein [Dehalobacter sp. 4CP]
MKKLKKIIIICGHYGSGKTNFSVNLAIDLKKNGDAVTLTDMDIVNPYFRSSDHTAMLESKGIKVISPVYANTNLDAPAIPAAIFSAFDTDGYSIFDMGGDDAGATVMGQFFKNMKYKEYDMLYVINSNRALIGNIEDATGMLRSIETASRLKATYIVNNSHLKGYTVAKDIIESSEYAKQVSDNSGLEILCTTYPKNILTEEDVRSFGNITEDLYPVEVFVKTPWE